MAEPREEMLVVEDPADTPRELHEDLIGSGVAMLVDERLKVVDADEDDGEGRQVAVRVGELGLEGLSEVFLSVGAGKRIDAAGVDEMLLKCVFQGVVKGELQDR